MAADPEPFLSLLLTLCPLFIFVPAGIFIILMIRRTLSGMNEGLNLSRRHVELQEQTVALTEEIVRNQREMLQLQRGSAPQSDGIKRG